MGEVIDLKTRVIVDENKEYENAEIITISDDLLLNTNVDIANDAKIKIPIGQLASLGAGVSSLIPAFRTVTDTITFSGPKLYEIANMGIGDVLKTTKAGISYGAIKTPDGISKMAQLKEAGALSATSTSVAAFNPATIMMAAALFSIDQKLGSIMENEKKILSHLKFEKESSVEGDLKTLNSIIKEYKYNWDNESFVKDHHKLALDIKRTSLAHIGSYQKEIESVLAEEKAIIVKSNVSTKLQELKEQFMYYRLSIYTFTLASFIEVMLSENYKEENILGKEEAIEKYSLEYRKLFTKSSSLIEKLSKKSIEGTLLRGIGNTGKVAGNLIANIPLIKEGPVDELLLKGGEALKNSSEKMSEQYTWSFAEMADPNTSIFLEKLDDMIYIYNKTSRICFDEEQIYLIAE